MSLNLKDDETVALVSEVARRLGLTKTGAVRALAQQRLDELNDQSERVFLDRENEIMAWLEHELPPRLTRGKRLSKTEEEDLLGYHDMVKR